MKTVNPNPWVHLLSGKLSKTSLPTWTVDPLAGIFLSSMNTKDGFTVNLFNFASNLFSLYLWGWNFHENESPKKKFMSFICNERWNINVKIYLHEMTVQQQNTKIKSHENQGSHRLWKSWKIAEKSPMHGKAMEFEKWWKKISWNFGIWGLFGYEYHSFFSRSLRFLDNLYKSSFSLAIIAIQNSLLFIIKQIFSQ